LRLETVKQEIKEFVDIHLYVDIDRLSFEVDDGVSQFLRKGSLLIPELKASEKKLNMMEKIL
jgi:hypothetical protein